jgi:hypothetical protein
MVWGICGNRLGGDAQFRAGFSLILLRKRLVMDPLTTPRTSSIEDEDGNLIQIPDQRPCVQRLHDALEETCARLLKSGDQPSVGVSRHR